MLLTLQLRLDSLQCTQPRAENYARPLGKAHSRTRYGNICNYMRQATKDLRKSHKSPFLVVLNTTLCSLDVNISTIRTTASDKEQERRYPWNTHPYHLPCVQFVTFRLTIFAALPRTMDRSNAKLVEGVTRLF